MAIQQSHINTKTFFLHFYFHICCKFTKTYQHKKSFFGLSHLLQSHKHKKSFLHFHFHIYDNPTSGGCDDWQPGRLLRAGKAERDWDLAQTMVLQTCPRILWDRYMCGVLLEHMQLFKSWDIVLELLTFFHILLSTGPRTEYIPLRQYYHRCSTYWP